MNTLLSVQDIETAYGSSQVLFGLSFEIREGETATLLGRNGVGKTTTLRSILGLTPVQRGAVHFCGQRIDAMATDHIARLGMAIVPEGRRIFPNLTVRENLLAFAGNRSKSQNPWTLQRIHALFPPLQQRSNHMGNQLSGGEQQMLAIGRALMTNPRLLILDEASEGLSPHMREEIWRCLGRLRAHGQTILIIDKYVERLLSLADHHTVIERGRVAWSGSSGQLRAAPDIWQRYVGV
ncbi:ABC transporter ATP-binding protein [Verminephrobacter eiseniae]|uniref:ABC transporter ATP-binding protein n=1 Tax=Verminephrobacter eiseniae TaxID=364317 RepID=UPI0010CED067|nr:ABC transporter ATP-binding protein [Verminephrobacter eiseniae]KAB7585005.1 ABC transporter ATP-binding protein [Verminephrobacter sp. Larva24]MCW5229802.1 ABC transporter ATP-binding protein [Verminephrobacter eiseniae]MCW5291533.1 ABC transporter ATP-binding protein [Verminephrobacter eiseniae]MCW8186462.1 ABC transporter ATP-binding protein [Verminephrobacter eiseniae]MCW8222864.1 ABC transporter ATP-binding protein [Verminephrobacter eiseniae]